ncbi:unnamed protein product [Ilex paraguariensis]|uniref:Uncharacterized protein n=1 Tax=Ilex paraguariensis TaxID=185542 RepID=A0ABC8U3Q0_9AQUA
MSPARLSPLIPSTISLSSPLPPKSPIAPLLSPQCERKHHQIQRPQLRIDKISRRDAAVLLSIISLIPSLHQPSPAAAFSFGISGPKDWLREQKKKSSKFLLAPIDASRNSLRTARLLLTNDNTDNGDKELEEIQRLLISAARDCVPEERNSFVSFQASTGVEVCTFRLVMKNAASLLGDKDPVKLEAEAVLSDLIRSFSFLNGLASETNMQLTSSRQKLADALMDTISALNKFEHGVKDCLEV